MTDSKTIHKNNLLRIAAAAIEHASKSVEIDPGAKQLIDQRIASVLAGKFDAGAIKTERNKRKGRGGWGYNSTNRMLEASEELVLLADHGGHPSGSKVQVVLVAAWDACGIDDYQKQSAEQNWQNSNLEPLIEKAFEQYGTKLEQIPN